MKRTKTTTATVVADICLYGNRETGAGFLGVRYPHGQSFGTGDPVKGRSFTDALFLAMSEVPPVRGGVVRVFDAGGERTTTLSVNLAVPYYGDIVWREAPVYTISAAALIAASEKGGA